MAPTTTTIKGVQILTKKRARRADVFDITLSIEGIQVLRPGRTAQHMGWDRVSQWEIEERSGYVLLTLRGDGAVTPLVVRGWTLDDLEVVMRDITAGAPRAEPVLGEPEPLRADPDGPRPRLREDRVRCWEPPERCPVASIGRPPSSSSRCNPRSRTILTISRA